MLGLSFATKAGVDLVIGGSLATAFNMNEHEIEKDENIGKPDDDLGGNIDKEKYEIHYNLFIFFF
jgi:hypothetical protein